MKDDYGFTRLHSEYFYHLIDDGREYRIYRKSTHALVAGGYLATPAAAIAEAKRHIARLQRADQKVRGVAEHSYAPSAEVSARYASAITAKIIGSQS